MAGITDELKKSFGNKEIDSNLLVPLNIWLSGYQSNIETCQSINYMFTTVNKDILSHKLTLNNKLKHFIKYPKVAKDDPKLEFFYRDLAKYFNWSLGELKKNLNVINLEELKPIISSKFGYSNEERKLIGVDKLKWVKTRRVGKKKNIKKFKMEKMQELKPI